MTHSPIFILYFTLGCHLCELAEDIITEVNVLHSIAYNKYDIADDNSLIERYGIRIPVLKNSINNAELNWPFTTQQLYEFVNLA